MLSSCHSNVLPFCHEIFHQCGTKFDIMTHEFWWCLCVISLCSEQFKEREWGQPSPPTLPLRAVRQRGACCALLPPSPPLPSFSFSSSVWYSLHALFVAVLLCLAGGLVDSRASVLYMLNASVDLVLNECCAVKALSVNQEKCQVTVGALLLI